jgi:hypothetical protein
MGKLFSIGNFAPMILPKKVNPVSFKKMVKNIFVDLCNFPFLEIYTPLLEYYSLRFWPD